MAGDSLYKIVSDALTDGKEKGKSAIGYTVRSYEGVLKDLQKVDVIYKDVEVQGVQTVSGYIGKSYYTKLGELGYLGERDEKGFIVNSDESLSYQAECEVKDYMSYVVDSFDKKTNKTQRCFVTNEKHNNHHVNNGLTLQNSSQPTFPMKTLQSDDVKKLSSGCGGDNNPCKIGVGISIGYFGLEFFKRFFGDMKWTASALSVLASKGYLYAEVLFPKGDEKAWVWHAKVTINDGGAQGSAFTLWMPIPVLLLNDFNSLGKVALIDVNGAEQIVGSGAVTFPLAGSRYYHKDASITNFTPAFLKAYVHSGEATTKHQCTSLSNQGSQKTLRVRVRLYFDKDAKSDIESKVGQIPAEYEKNLFSGEASDNSIVDYDEVKDGFIYSGGISIKYFEEIAKEIGMNPVLVERAFMAVGIWESGGRWGMWEHCKLSSTGEYDNQGISAGLLQFTQVAEGILDYRNFYTKLQAANPDAAPPMSKEMYEDILTYNKQNNSPPLKKYASQFYKQSKTSIGKQAQMLTWQGSGSNRGKKQYTLQWFKQLNCTTAAELTVLLSLFNHLPNYYKKVLPRYQDDLLKVTDPIAKAKMIEAIHWKEYENYGGASSRAGNNKLSIAEIVKNGVKGTYKSRCERTFKLLGTNNKDLNGLQKFCTPERES